MSIWFGTPTPEDANLQAQGNLLEHLGIEFVEFGDDFIKARMPVDHRTRQPYGVLHGGASVALAETLASFGAVLTLDPAKHHAMGMEINANHIRPVASGWVTGVARQLTKGRTTQVWDIRITDEADRVVCISRCTMAVVAAKPHPVTEGQGPA
ncbi:MAG TPA: hotdog fold thioesterase [Candidatus Lumbricidophila sp.]|nr:hotdog fold thioesterase [Candidatus Lumbricidophila sp.]